METNYVLVDLENIQPRNLELLRQHPFKVIVFVGSNQNKLPFELVQAMQDMGDAGRYIKIDSAGKNALDFHIAYYVGELTSKEPKANFHIISKDTGFDPLIKHLKSKGIKVQREQDLAQIPTLRVSSASTNDEKIAAIVKNLAGRGQSRPRKVKTLTNTINSLSTDKLNEEQLSVIVEELQKKNFIKVADGNVSYTLPH